MRRHAMLRPRILRRGTGHSRRPGGRHRGRGLDGQVEQLPRPRGQLDPDPHAGRVAAECPALDLEAPRATAVVDSYALDLRVVFADLLDPAGDHLAVELGDG